MAKYIGLLSSDMRGKTGGLVFSRGRSGTVLRKKAGQVQPATSLQLYQRGLFAQASQAWQQLAPNQIALWNKQAALLERTNSLGEVSTLSGFQLWCQRCNNLSVGQQGQLTTPIVPFDGYVISQVAIEELAATLVFEDAHLLVACVPSFVDDNCSAVVEATPNLSAGVSYIQPAQWRVITVLYGGAGIERLDVVAAWQEVFGQAIAGATVGVRLRQIEQTTGVATPWSSSLAVWTEVV